MIKDEKKFERIQYSRDIPYSSTKDCLGSFTCPGIGPGTRDLGLKSHPKDPKVCTVGRVQHFLPEILSPQVLDRPGIEPPT